MIAARSRLLVAVGVAIVYLLVVHYLFDLNNIFNQWRDLPSTTLLASIAALVLSYVLRAWRYQVFFALDHFPATMRMTLIHNAFNHWLPARTGELSFPLLMKRYFGQSYAGATHGLLWLRLMDLHALAGAVLPLIYLLADVWLFVIVSISWLIAMPLALWLLARLRVHIATNSHSGRLLQLLQTAVNDLTATKRNFYLAWLLSIANWGTKIGMLTLLVTAFAPVALSSALLAVIAGELTSILPIHSPGGLGTYEAGMAAAFSLFDIDFKTGLQAAVQAHLFLLNLAIISAVCALLLPVKR